MGGVLEENWCAFDGRKFKCLYITKDFVLDCLRKAGMELNVEEVNEDFSNNQVKLDYNIVKKTNKTIVFFELNGMFMVSCKKKLNPNL